MAGNANINTLAHDGDEIQDTNNSAKLRDSQRKRKREESNTSEEDTKIIKTRSKSAKRCKKVCAVIESENSPVKNDNLKRKQMRHELDKRNCQINTLTFKNRHLKQQNIKLNHELENQRVPFHFSKSSLLLVKLLREKCLRDRMEAKLKCQENAFKIGYFCAPEGDFDVINWVDGTNVIQLLTRRLVLLNQIEKIKEQIRLALECKQPNPEAWTLSGERKFFEAEEILNAQLNSLKKEELVLQSKLEDYEIERNLHVRELKRIHAENHSRFKDCPVVHERYLFLKLLGKGGFGEVYQAFDLVEYRYVACKVQEPNETWSAEKKARYMKRALQECEIQKVLDHPRIVKLFEVFYIAPNCLCTVLEYCEGDNLEFYLKQHRTLSELEAKSIVRQIASALMYLNEIKPSVIHYDLKPANILMTKSDSGCNEIKIADFGLSKATNEESLSPDHEMYLSAKGRGTYYYLPPECFVDGDKMPKISSKVDVWSVGVILFECLYGEKPFGKNESQATILKKNIIIKATKVKFPKKPHVSIPTKNFIKSCLTYKKEERMDVRALFNHEYLQPPKYQSKQQQQQPNLSSTNGQTPFNLREP